MLKYSKQAKKCIATYTLPIQNIYNHSGLIIIDAMCTTMSFDYLDFWLNIYLILYPSLWNLTTHIAMLCTAKHKCMTFKWAWNQSYISQVLYTLDLSYGNNNELKLQQNIKSWFKTWILFQVFLMYIQCGLSMMSWVDPYPFIESTLTVNKRVRINANLRVWITQ